MKAELLEVIGTVNTHRKTDGLKLESWGFKTTYSPPRNYTWIPSMHGHFKLNVDISKKGTAVAYGGILRDDKGNLIWATMGHMQDMGVVEAEAWGIYECCKRCSEAKLEWSEVESDSQTVVGMLHGSVTAAWRVRSVIEDTKLLLQNRKVSHIRRQQNHVADGISKWARNCHVNGSIWNISLLPKSIRGSILVDKKGYPCML